MRQKRTLPFQWLVTLRVAALVLVLTALFLWVVLGRVQRQTDQAAHENFGMLARSAFGELDAIANSYLNYLDTLAQLLPTSADPDSAHAHTALARSLLRQAGPNTLTIARANDDMLFIRKINPGSPPGTAYSVGRIGTDARGMRTQAFSFHAADGTRLGGETMVTRPRPTESDWYRGARRSGHQYLTAAYRVDDSGELGTTLATALPGSVVALTTPLQSLDGMLERVPLSPNAAVLLIDDQERVVALRTRGAHWGALDTHTTRLRTVDSLGHAVLVQAARFIRGGKQNEPRMLRVDGRGYLFAWHTVIAVPGTQYDLALVVPLDDLTGAARNSGRDAWLVALAGLALVLPLTWFGAGAMARVLQRLVLDSRRIERMDFASADAPIQSGVREVQALVQAQEAMRGSLAARTQALRRASDQLGHLVGIGMRMVQEKDRQALLDAIMEAVLEFAGARSAVLFVRDDDDVLRPTVRTGAARDHVPPDLDLKLPLAPHASLAAHSALTGRTSVVDDFETDPRPELATMRRYLGLIGFRIQSVLSLPLRTPAGRVSGVIQIFNATDPATDQVIPFAPGVVRFVEALAAQAAVALENQKLIASQRHLLDALVHMLGGAIDAKSPYTGRHCARVPELAMMLAQEAHDADQGPLADFGFHTEEEWREFRTGAWLHDCGKITSPEHVIDKATKLETVHNRLHEIRTRFEVLLRDARIDTWRAEREGRIDADQAEAAYLRRAQELQEDYSFIAACNLGSEQMAAADITRVRAIAHQTWLRHFDDRLGLSHAEMERHRGEAPAPLPALEPLLADKRWHQVLRTETERAHLTEGFRMEVPELLYHHGELHNLCIDRGTLTREERFKVNEHIIHTIRMLEEARFPSRLRRVPEYAGTHHETLSGSGYPRGLSGDELSIPARIMAIADIFEALTAADRPYKRAKTLSESVAILHGLKRKGHIDPDIFDLFLVRGVHLRYAQRFLSPEQIDAVDITPYLG